MAMKNSSKVHKDGSTYTNQCDTSVQQKKTGWGGTQYDLLNRFRKNIWLNSTSTHGGGGNSCQRGCREDISQHNESHLWQTHSQDNTK